MSDASKQTSWTKPAALAIPKGGFFKDKVEQGRYGPVFPKTPACYGFSILAKVIPGREERFYEYARNIDQAVAAQPDCLAVLKLHYLRWVLFPIKGDTYFMYQGSFDTDFDKYTEDAVNLFAATGLRTVFENLEGFPMDWQTNPAAFVKFVRDHQCPSFLESLLQNSSNAANFPCVRGGGAAGAQAGAGLNCVTRSILSTASATTPNMRWHLTLIAPRTRTDRAPNSSFSRALTRSVRVRKSKITSSGSGIWMSFMRSTSLAHSALASCWARKLRSMIGAWPSALLWPWMAAAS